MKQYIALFEYMEGEEGYSVVFPDFPGCISGGDSYEEAIRMAHEGLSFHVASMKADGDPIPAPRTLEEIKATWEDWAEWEKEYKFLVGLVTLLPLRDISKRVNVTLSEKLLARIDLVTNNRSAFLEDAARRMLEEAH
jgi:predicted RNase H-like HicB family nuclease